MKKIAWIGTGVMGKPMALHLCNADYSVAVYNRTFEKAKALEPKAVAHQNIKDCIKNADLIMSIVGYPSDVKEVYSEIFKYAKKNAILVDLTTSSPTLAKELHEEAKKHHLSMLDAPVTGGDLGAINQTLSIMVGGDEEVFQQVLPIFQVLGKTITYMGKAGSGQHAKLANQIAIAGTILGVAEAISYAKAQGLNLASMLDVIDGGSASSWQAKVNGRKMLIKDYKPGFFIKHFMKDLKLAAEEQHVNHPILEKTISIYQKLIDQGLEDQGTQAIIEYYFNQ